MKHPHNCDAMNEQIVALVDGELLPGEAEAVLEQTLACPTCAAELDSYRNLAGSFQQFVEAGRPEEAFWEGYQVRLSTRFETSDRSGSAKPLLLQMLRAAPVASWTAVAASVALVAVLTWTNFRVGTPPPLITAVPRLSVPPPIVPPESTTERSAAVSPGRVSVPGPAPRRAPDAVGSSVLARHLENVGLLFRRLENDRRLTGLDPTRARLLLDHNQVLRREAERQRDQNVEAVLVRLEPALLDLAHLDADHDGGVPEPVLKRIRRQEYLLATVDHPTSEVLP